MLNFLHVSDLHFTSQEEGQRRDYCRGAVNAILRLVDELSAKGVLGSPLYLAVTGDLVQSGEISNEASDFDSVQEHFLAPLLEKLEIPSAHVFIVPGNHEMDRNAIADEQFLIGDGSVSEGQASRDLCKKLETFFNFIEKNGYNSVSRGSPRIQTFDVRGQQVVCLNGLVGSYSRQGLGDKGHLFVLPTEMAGVFSEISERAIILTHHPLSWFSDDCEMMLRDFFALKRCRLLTGHIHNEGIAEISNHSGSYVTIQAGATSEVGESQFTVALAWLPESNSAAVRHFRFDAREARFPITPVGDTKVAPTGSKGFFERTEAFFDPSLIIEARTAATVKAEKILSTTCGIPPEKYVSPDLMQFTEDHFSGKRVRIEDLLSENGNVLISGDELAGKSSLLGYLAYRRNKLFEEEEEGTLSLLLDFREFTGRAKIDEFISDKVSQLGMSTQQAEYLITVGKIHLYIDNVDTGDRLTLKAFVDYCDRHPQLRWTGATRGGERFMPSRAPTDLTSRDLAYYQLSETTLPTVLKLIENHESCDNAERPRAIVQRVFQSIHNLSAPRTMFYVQSMLDIFLTDASVEPLNRYLLIENLISDRIRDAHREVFPGQAIDMQMLDAFIGTLAHYLLREKKSFATKAEFLTLVEEFISRKGVQRKRFDPEKILEILVSSCVLRPYSSGYGFVILSIEDYFLAKHMGHDDNFRGEVLTSTGLLTLPSVAEYYIAQNPSDQARLDIIFGIIDDFEKHVQPVVDAISSHSIGAIKSAAPGKHEQIQEDLLEEIAEVDGADEPSMIRISEPVQVGDSRRIRRAVEEQGAVYLQLGASILGVTRTLDQKDRIKIFDRLRSLLLVCVTGTPLIAQHLADGNEVKFRGATVKAEYTGKLAVQEDRFYIILRGMLHNLLKNFATWSGSPSFFNSAVKLREKEEDEIVSAALFAQNIEADLADSLEFISDVPDKVESLILQEIIARLYLDSMTLVPLERADEKRAIDKLVDLTSVIVPPAQSSADAIKRHKDRLRRNFSETIGVNTYIGRRIRKDSKSKD